MKLKNWSLVPTHAYSPSEEGACAAGLVYGHPTRPDGQPIRTSVIVNTEPETSTVITFSGSRYRLLPGDVAPAYEEIYPDAYNRIFGDRPPFVAAETDDWRVEIVNLNEGRVGEYDPTDPQDVNYLRFDLYRWVELVWVIDVSWCTAIRADEAEIDDLRKFGREFIRRLEVEDSDPHTIASAMSWFDMYEGRELE